MNNRGTFTAYGYDKVNTVYRGCRIVVTEFKQSGKTGYECTVYNTPLLIKPFTGDNPERLKKEAIQKIDLALKHKPL